MSNNTISSIETLPVEIFHRIFDNLDAKTILSSLRRTSLHRFTAAGFTAVNNYTFSVVDTNYTAPSYAFTIFSLES